MKKFPFKLALIALTSLSFFSVVAGTISWFNPRLTVDNSTNTQNNISGEVEGAYFAYGDGILSTSEGDGHRAYGITKPRHLYNLAWLQYIGHFEHDDPEDELYGKQFYFELAEDLDMTDWVLPPIGTEDNPFVGNFNGNGHIISNLTVSNNFEEFNTHPSAILGWDNDDYKQPHIIGFFGVVGNYEDSFPGSYSPSINEFKNTALSDIKVKSYVADSLVGLAAGYVDANMSNVAVDAGTIDINKEAIGNTTTSSYGGFTSNISDHTIIGHTTKKTQIKKVSDTLYGIDLRTEQEFNANAQGSGNQGWGGSIDMMSMFQRLNNIRTNATATSTSYTYRTETSYIGDDSLRGQPVDSTLSAGSYGKYYRSTGDNATAGNFMFLPGSEGQADRYMYLGGGERKINNYYYYTPHTGKYITDGTNYLVCDDSGVKNYSGNDPLNNATKWSFVQRSGSTYYIRVNYENQTAINRYLYNDNGNLAVGTGTSTDTNARWTVNQDGDNLTLVNGNYKIHYYNGVWRLIPTTDSSALDYYLIKNYNNNYINASSTSGSTPTNATNQNNAAHFYVDGGTNYIYFLKDNIKLYLAIYYTYSVQYNNWDGYYINHSLSLRLIDQVLEPKTGNEYYYFTYSNNVLASSVNAAEISNNAIVRTPTNVYAIYYGGWTYTTNSSYAATPIAYNSTANYSQYKLNNTFDDADVTATGPDDYEDLTKKEKYNQYTDTNTTYFPLNVKQDGGTTASYITNGNYRPVDANTGYVVAGSTLSDDGTVSNASSQIRVSRYHKRFVSSNRSQTIKHSFKFNGSEIQNGDINADSRAAGTIADSDVRTISSSGDVALTTAYPNPTASLNKYGASKDTLLGVLRSDDYNFGLHFMDSQISKDDVVKATNVYVLGQLYGNPNDTNEKKRTYDMPVNSIDFRLKEKGYINFFAGTYYSEDVTSFFSLHQVFRDTEANGYAITGIKEIAKIYGNIQEENGVRLHNNWSYAFKYTDNTYSKPYKFNGKNEKFELDSVSVLPDFVERNDLSSSEFELYQNTYNYVELFDTEWITNFAHSDHSQIFDLNQEYLYYFEIPINQGEFCLGSVQGGYGGYLLYLDIGANAAKTQRTMVAEHFLHEEFAFTYPLGAAIIQTSTIEGNEPTFREINGICFVIEATYKGEFVVDRTENTVTAIRDETYYNVARPSYISDTITSVVDPGKTPEDTSDDVNLVNTLKYDSALLKETYRIQYYDYNVNYSQKTITEISDVRTKENDGAWSAFARTVRQKVDNGAFVTLTSQTQIDSGAITIFKYFGKDNALNGTGWSYSDIMNLNSNIYYNGSSVTSATVCASLQTTILELYHILTGNVTTADTITLELDDQIIALEGGNTFTSYVFLDYIFIPVATGGSVKFIVKSIDGDKTFYFIDSNTTLEEVDQEETVNP